MEGNQTYFYMRLKENFFDSNEMVVLESLPDGYMFSNILLKLYLRSLRDEGKLMFNNAIPFNAQMIATITRHKVETVERALETFQRMGLIEILDSGAIYMLDIQNYIGKSSTEADRKREYREKIDREKMECLSKRPDKSPSEITKEQDSDGKIAFQLPTSEGKPFTIYRAQVENLSRRFLAIDVEAELGGLDKWLQAHPEKRKTRSETNNIMERWLSAAQEKVKHSGHKSVYEAFDESGLGWPENM